MEDGGRLGAFFPIYYTPISYGCRCTGLHEAIEAEKHLWMAEVRHSARVMSNEEKERKVKRLASKIGSQNDAQVIL